MECGIVGLPNVGKSTLFNALLKKRVALSANYPFATVEPNVGVVEVPDVRLEKLAEIIARNTPTSEEADVSLRFNLPPSEVSKKRPPIVPAVVQFVDIAGLVKGAHKGEGLGNQFLSHIREVDAIIHVLRDFEDEDVVRSGSTDPLSDKEIVETELALADLETIEKLIYAQEKEAKYAKDSQESQKLEVLRSVKSQLEKEKLEHGSKFANEDTHKWYKNLPLLSLKPVLYVYNVSESHYVDKSHSRSGTEIVIAAKLEEELADLNEEERKEYLKGLGLQKTGLERLINRAYDLLDLVSFLTAGEKEVRAWTIKQGTKAPQAAGVIHTDFEKGFIKAEVINYEELVRLGSFKRAKELGKIKLEGRDYLVKDGDVVTFRFGL